jgi:hypothetical protein
LSAGLEYWNGIVPAGLIRSSLPFSVPVFCPLPLGSAQQSPSPTEM